MATPGYLPPPTDASDDSNAALRRFTRQIAQAVQLLMRGKMNNTVELTLTPGAAATVWEDPRLTSTSAVVFDPLTANAAAELAAGTMYVLKANRNNGSWTITHANAATTDRTFRAAIIG